MKVGRNAPCTCGSGKKYKQCHGKTDQERKHRWSVYALLIPAIAIIVGGGELLLSLFRDPPEGSAGRVWSTEHGHWHDANGGELGAAPGGVPASPQAQPPGPPPPGKVWSSEHGHWHDA